MEAQKNTSEACAINNVRQPVSDFSETTKYLDVLGIVESEIFAILHCHGFAGTGKSSIVQKLAEKFPFFEDALAIKFHIECDKQGQDLKKNMLKMLEIMKKNHHMKELKENTIFLEMEKNKADTLVKVLCQCESSILIIIEDIKHNNTQFLLSLLVNLEKQACNASKIHVYITTREEKLNFPSSVPLKVHSVNITGFTEKEGIKYLINGGDSSPSNMEAAKTVVKRFSAAPLGLKAAKEFCKVHDLSYENYMELIKEDSGYVSNKELDLIETHIYQAITFPFTRGDAKDRERDWWVLTCLSYLHHSEIPCFLIQSLCQRYHTLKHKEKISKQKSNIEYKNLINNLELYHLCTKNKDNTGKLNSISCHEVVLNSFGWRKSEEGSPLKNLIFVLASLSTKDMRDKQIEAGMIKLIPHLHSLLKHCSDKRIFESRDEDWMLNNLVLAHLYEVLGAIGLQHEQAENCEGYLKVALQKILNIIKYIVKDSKELPIESILKSAKITDENVKSINDVCIEAGNGLPDGFIALFESKVIVLKQIEERKYLEKNSKDPLKFQELCKRIDDYGILDSSEIQVLRDCGIYLEENIHRNIFFSERIAMLLHSMSRVLVFDDLNKTENDFDHYKLCSNLAYQVAHACRDHAPLLMEYLSKTGGSISLLLKCKESKNQNELSEAKKYCLDAYEHISLMYEHGFMKECEDVMSKMQLLRYVVRINCRLVNCYSDNEKHEADMRCEELFQLANKNPGVAMANNCLVYCAKYLAKKGDNERAFQYFDKFFENVKQGGKTKTIAWGTFNYARAVWHSHSFARSEDAVTRCKNLLENFVIRSPSLVSHLQDFVGKLSAVPEVSSQ